MLRINVVDGKFLDRFCTPESNRSTNWPNVYQLKRLRAVHWSCSYHCQRMRPRFSDTWKTYSENCLQLQIFSLISGLQYTLILFILEKFKFNSENYSSVFNPIAMEWEWETEIVLDFHCRDSARVSGLRWNYVKCYVWLLFSWKL